MEIIKKGYSSNPWRLIDGEGREIYIKAFIDAQGAGLIDAPLCGNTKKECLSKALDLLEHFLNQNN